MEQGTAEDLREEPKGRLEDRREGDQVVDSVLPEDRAPAPGRPSPGPGGEVFSFAQAKKLYEEAPEGAYKKALRTVLALHAMILEASTTEQGRALWRRDRDLPHVLRELSRLFEKEHGGKPDLFGEVRDV